MYDLLIRNAVLVTPDGECEKIWQFRMGRLPRFWKEEREKLSVKLMRAGDMPFPESLIRMHTSMSRAGHGERITSMVRRLRLLAE